MREKSSPIVAIVCFISDMLIDSTWPAVITLPLESSARTYSIVDVRQLVSVDRCRNTQDTVHVKRTKKTTLWKKKLQELWRSCKRRGNLSGLSKVMIFYLILWYLARVSFVAGGRLVLAFRVGRRAPIGWISQRHYRCLWRLLSVDIRAIS